jgi:hypothetical protein
MKVVTGPNYFGTYPLETADLFLKINENWRSRIITGGISSSTLKPVFHFNRIVAKRSVFLCFLSTRVELMTSTQKKMLRYVTLRYDTLEVENGLNKAKE